MLIFILAPFVIGAIQIQYYDNDYSPLNFSVPKTGGIQIMLI